MVIYNSEFVWLHVPKCAGTKIENLFKKYFSHEDGLFQDPVVPKNDLSCPWHNSTSDREASDPEFKLDGRTVICSFRRLPSWLESRYNFEVQRNPHLPHNPELLFEGKFLEANGYVGHADYYAKKYLPETILKTGKVRFLRTEFFETDFKLIFGDFLPISRIPDWELKKKVNISKSSLPPHIKEQLYGQKKVYEKCPYWRSVEEMAYGSL